MYAGLTDVTDHCGALRRQALFVAFSSVLPWSKNIKKQPAGRWITAGLHSSRLACLSLRPSFPKRSRFSFSTGSYYMRRLRDRAINRPTDWPTVNFLRWQRLPSVLHPTRNSQQQHSFAPAAATAAFVCRLGSHNDAFCLPPPFTRDPLNQNDSLSVPKLNWTVMQTKRIHMYILEVTISCGCARMMQKHALSCKFLFQIIWHKHVHM